MFFLVMRTKTMRVYKVLILGNFSLHSEIRRLNFDAVTKIPGPSEEYFLQ